MAAEETRRDVVDAVLGLDEPYRTAILLRYYDGLPPRRIADRLGVPSATLRSHLHRGLQQLRARLDHKHGSRSAWASALLPIVRAPHAATPLALLAMTAKTKKLTAALTAIVIVACTAWGWAVTRDSAPAPRDSRSSSPRQTGVATERDEPRSRREIAPAPTAEPGLYVVAAEDRAPIAGARVEAFFADGNTWRGITDSDGRAMAEGSGPATVWASADGRPLARLDTELGDQDVKLALAQAESVQLRFFDPGGQLVPGPLARARFDAAELPPRALLVADGQLAAGGLEQLMRLRFGDAGHWRLPITLLFRADGAVLSPSPGPGRWRLYLERPAAGPYLTDAFEPNGAPVKVPLVATTAQRLVRLLDEATGMPLAGLQVRAQAAFGEPEVYFGGCCRTVPAHGEIRLPVARRGDTLFRGESGWWAQSDSHAVQFRVQDEPGPLEVRVPRRGVVTGTAYRRDGALAVGDDVLCDQDGLITRSRVRPDGTYELRGIRATRSRQVMVILFERESDALGHAVQGQLAREGVTRVNLGKAGAGMRITGRVTAGGTGVPGILVGARQGPGGNKQSWATTAADGSFALVGGVAGARLTLLLGDPRASDDFALTCDETLAAGEHRDIAIDLPTATIRVLVVDAETQAPIVGAKVTARPDRAEAGRSRFPGWRYRPGWGAMSGEGGTAELLGLLEGERQRVDVRATGYRHHSALVPLPARGGPVRVELERRQ